MISTPFSVLRDVTKTAMEKLSAASNQSSLETRLVLSEHALLCCVYEVIYSVLIAGQPGCGKSYTLLQSLEYCFSNDWIVLYFPRGETQSLMA
jgi:small subunit ribosomal protein S29